MDDKQFQEMVKDVQESLDNHFGDRSELAKKKPIPPLSAKESEQFFQDKVDLARNKLNPQEPVWATDLPADHLEWYKNDKALIDAIKAAETNPALFAFLKNWVGGNLELEFPDPVPAPLLGFMRDLIGGRFKQPQGNGKRELDQGFVKDLVGEIQLVYGGTQDQARAAIAEASDLSQARINKIYYQKN